MRLPREFQSNRGNYQFVLWLLSLCRGRRHSLSLNSCHHVVVLFWTRVLSHLTVEEARLRMRIILGVVLFRSPWFVLDAYREGSGVVPERPCSSGFIRKSWRRANAPRVRFSVLLNSFDSLFVNLPSISSDT